jgi:hypothetical protein
VALVLLLCSSKKALPREMLPQRRLPHTHFHSFIPLVSFQTRDSGAPPGRASQAGAIGPPKSCVSGTSQIAISRAPVSVTCGPSRERDRLYRVLRGWFGRGSPFHKSFRDDRSVDRSCEAALAAMKIFLESSRHRTWDRDGRRRVVAATSIQRCSVAHILIGEA